MFKQSFVSSSWGKINRDCISLCYMFKNPKHTHTNVPYTPLNKGSYPIFIHNSCFALNFQRKCGVSGKRLHQPLQRPYEFYARNQIERRKKSRGRNHRNVCNCNCMRYTIKCQQDIRHTIDVYAGNIIDAVIKNVMFAITIRFLIVCFSFV